MVEEMTAEELHARLAEGDAVQVIDVRPERAFRRGHVPGAENVPITRFARAVADHEWSEEIVLICPHGESSLQAARLLEAYEGVSEDAWIANVSDGYAGWAHELESA